MPAGDPDVGRARALRRPPGRCRLRTCARALLGGLVALFGLVAPFGLAACAREPGAQALAATPPAASGRVERGDLEERLLLTGRLRAVRSVALTAPRTRMWNVSVRWMVDDGQAVKRGDRVVELDNSVFASEVQEKKLLVRQAALDFAIGAAVAARGAAEKRFEVERQKVLLEKASLLAAVPRDLLPGRTYEERQLERERARVAVERAEEDLRTHEHTAALEQEVKRIALEKAKRAIQATEESLASLVLSAPEDGVAIVADHPWERRKIVVGDALQPGWTVVEMPDPSAMEVEAVLSDVDDGRLAVGARVTCILDAYPDLRLDGTVAEVSPVAREAGRSSLRRAFDVKIALDHTDPARMRPGMSVKVEAVRRVTGALLVPRAALDFGHGLPVLRLRDGGTRPVKLGPCDGRRCAVEDPALREGQAL